MRTKDLIGESFIDKIASRIPNSIYENEILMSNGESVFARHILFDEGKTAIVGLDELVDCASFLFEKETRKIVTSYGIGQLIQLVLNKGCNRIVLCIDGWELHDCEEKLIDVFDATFKFREDSKVVFECMNGNDLMFLIGLN